MQNTPNFTTLCQKIAADQTLTPSQVSLIMAIFRLWQINQEQNPIVINRKELMSLSKINAYATYHKNLKILNKKKFIAYHPSFHPKGDSKIYLLP